MRYKISWLLFVALSHYVNAEQVFAVQGKEKEIPCFDTSLASKFNDFYVSVSFKSSTLDGEICQYKFSNKKLLDKMDAFKGRIALTNLGTFKISGIKLDDEGTYTCTSQAFTLDVKPTVTNIIVYVKPTVEVQKVVDPLRADSAQVEAAWCTAVEGKPAASVKWLTDKHRLFNETTQDIDALGQARGLVSVRKVLNIEPTKYYNKMTFYCEIKHPAFEDTITKLITLNVTFPPSTVAITTDGKSLTCNSESNPPPHFTWVMPPISTNRQVTGPTVNLISPQDANRSNDSYTCVVSNGIKPDQTGTMTTRNAATIIEMTAQSNVGAIVGGIIGGLILLMIIGFLVYFFFLRPSREKDTGPYQQTGSPIYRQSSRRPMIEHANESLHKSNRPPSPVAPPPDEKHDTSDLDSSDSDEGNHDVDVVVNPATNLIEEEDQPDVEIGGITSRASINFQPYWRESISEARRKRPSTSPAHRQSRSDHNNRKSGSPNSVSKQPPQYDDPPVDDDQSNGHYPTMHDEQFQGYGDDEFNEPYHQPAFVNYPQGGQPPRRMDSLPHQEPKYTEIDHSRYKPANRRPQYEEPVEYAQIRHGYTHVV